MNAQTPPAPSRPRVSAAERRDALIAAAVHEFAHGGLHGTPVDRIARRVGVAQPYVFSLFATKRELFLAAVERGFDHVEETFSAAAAEFHAAYPPAGGDDVLAAMGRAYIELLGTNRDELLLQHQSFAACDDDVVRERVRARWARLVAHVTELSGAPEARLDDFFRQGMALNVAAAMGVENLSVACEWIKARAPDPAAEH